MKTNVFYDDLMAESDEPTEAPEGQPEAPEGQ